MSIRVLQLLSSSGYYGAENVIIQLSKELTKKNVFTLLGVFRNSNNPNIDIASIAKEESLPFCIFDCRGRFDFKATHMIRKVVAQNAVNIIHSHGFKANIYNLLTSRAQIRRISTCHNWIGADNKIRFYNYLDKNILRYFDKVVAVNNSIKKELIKFGVKESRIEVVNNGIEIERFQIPDEIRKKCRLEFGLANDEKVVGTVSRLSEEKNIQLLLLAVKYMTSRDSKTKLVIAGDGPYRQFLEKETDRLGIRGQVIFTGFRKDIPVILSIFDAFVLPSLKEGLPMAILEVMAAKKPIISTPVGAIPEVIKDEESGLLLDDYNPEILSEKILTILNRQDLSQRLSENAYKTVKRSYSSENMCQEYLKLYQELVA